LRKAKHLAQTIEELDKLWKPHEAQIKIGRSLFRDYIRRIFIQCGRKFGKTDIVDYFLWRWARMMPNQHCYYMAPYQKQAKEIVWASKRIQSFGPKDWIASINNTDLRIKFTNGSFIKVDGSDNYEAYRGINPHFMVYDEFKDFRPQFHQAMNPNLSVYNAPLVIIGTPPDHENQFTEIADEFKADPDSRFFSFPTSSNPYINKEWLAKEKARLIARGDEAEWLREYEGLFVKGGKRSILPMIHHLKSYTHEELVELIRKDVKALEFFVITDPGSTTCHASLFMAWNPYSKKMYLIDEIYERSQIDTSTRKIGTRIIEKVKEISQELKINIDAWTFWRDEAAAWFEVEMSDLFGPPWIFTPVAKANLKKEVGLSTIKDAMIEGAVVMSERCEKLRWEAQNYISDENGKIPKVNDHLIDCWRYGIGVIGADLNPSRQPEPDVDRGGRGYRIEDDLEEDSKDDSLMLGGFEL
jgi:hypothetical protein